MNGDWFLSIPLFIIMIVVGFFVARGLKAGIKFVVIILLLIVLLFLFGFLGADFISNILVLLGLFKDVSIKVLGEKILQFVTQEIIGFAIGFVIGLVK